MPTTRFPQELPFEDIKKIITYVRGGGGTRLEAIDCAWWVAGYGLGKLPDNEEALAVFSVDDASLPETVASALEPLTQVGATGASESDILKGFDWFQMAGLLFQLIKLWRSQASGPKTMQAGTPAGARRQTQTEATGAGTDTIAATPRSRRDAPKGEGK